MGHPLGQDDLVSVAAQLAELWRRGARVVAADLPRIHGALLRLGVPRSALVPCQAGRGRLCVQADGWIGPCHPLRYPLVPAGPRMVARLLRHPDYRRLGQRRYAPCAHCPEDFACSSCRAMVVAQGLALLADDGACEGSAHRG